jgi:FkbM family methyltransferase
MVPARQVAPASDFDARAKTTSPFIMSFNDSPLAPRNLKQQILTLQDSRYRPVLSVALSAYKTLRTRELTVIRRDPDGDWRHRAGNVVIASPTLHLKDVPAMVHDGTDFWMHGYTPVPGDVIFDVGAGIGEDTLAFSRRVGPTGKVIAIEAHPRTFRCLKKTVVESKLSNVVPLDCALHSADGEITISDVPCHLDNTVVGSEDGIRIRARSIDSLVKELGLGRVDLLKMNIEGAEVAAIEGLNECVPRVRHVVVSCHDFIAERGGPAAMRTKSRVIDLLQKRGFRILPARTTSSYDWVRDYVYARRQDLAA